MNDIADCIHKLKQLGIDIEQSECADRWLGKGDTESKQKGCSEICSMEAGEQYISQVRQFMSSFVFLQLGQAIQKKQWQVASMKAMKLTKELQRLGMTKVNLAMTRIRQNINQKNRQEALQGLSALIQLRSKYFQIFGLREK